ncbi:MAG: hypothetical protein M1830_002264 [Pleopsidium flavum]|nr:MAG: hypothetical protein M1830_002264 [Pleopsidium flavum]
MALVEGAAYNSSSARLLPAALTPENPEYDTILHRANQIERQKDVELRILAATEILLDAGADYADPISFQGAASGLKEHLKSFQPNDYDSLIEERNINGKCGYALCPRPPRSENTGAKFRILVGKGRGDDTFRVVPRQKLEQWCSKECAKKALYIRVQLSEEPAWMRAEGSGVEVVLFEEVEAKQNYKIDVADLTGTVRSMTLDTDDDKIVKALDALALERGDTPTPGRASRSGQVAVHEHLPANTDRPAPPRRTEGLNCSSESVEGYKPKGAEGAIERHLQVFGADKESGS